MVKIKHTLFRSWYILETLEDRIFHIILDVSVFISVISVVAGLLYKAKAEGKNRICRESE